jgi:hypothetical protein
MANDPTCVDTKFYRVSPNDPVTLRVVIGDEQSGGTTVVMNGVEKQVTTGTLTLGTGGELLDVQVHCITTVKDINRQTNRTDVTYFLNGGPEGEVGFPFTVSAAEDGGYTRYLVDFAFL